MASGRRAAAVALGWLLVAIGASAGSLPGTDWPQYAADGGGSHYSPLGQITPQNVHLLKEQWSYRVDWPAGKPAAFESTPLKVGEMLYVCLPLNDMVALDASTGAVRWTYKGRLRDWTKATVCRGLAFAELSGSACPRRLYMVSVDATLRAIDADTGIACPDFGTDGRVDLLTGLGDVAPGDYVPTSPPSVIRGRVVVGSGVPDNGRAGNPSGVVRAYDAITGQFIWAWDLGRPGNHAEPQPGDRYTRNTPNFWSVASTDEALGLVYVPTGNSNPDYYGAHRTPEADKYSTSIVALDAASGEVRWSFQTVHHDLWDYDVGPQPSLVDWPTDSGTVPALVQATKTGQVFVLDRRDGHPLTEVTERAVPQGGGRGDWTAKTQPFSTGMPAFTGPDLKENDMWGMTPLDALWCRIQFRKARYDGPFTPPGDGSWIYSTGFLGGMDWGGVAVDKSHGILIVNSFIMASRNFFVEAADGHGDASKLPFPYFPQEGSPYYAVYTALFRSPTGMPCQRPPYGMVSAIDMRTHQLLWTHPLGTSRNAGPFKWQLPLDLPMGSPNIGGSAVTQTRLAFIGATLDQYFRALDVKTGAELWRVQLPSAAFANPMTYFSERSGRQYVAIAVGGNSLMGHSHGMFIKAFALP